jgi:cytochrome c-type biogenesis protein CcmH
MSWPVIALLAVLVLLALLAFRPARAHWRPLATALLLGLAGYALQGAPNQPGAAKARAEQLDTNAEAQVTARQKLAGGDDQRDAHLTIADAMIRHGQYANAAIILRGAVEKQPGNSQAWLAMANALVGHAQGTLSPPALYAYRQALETDPQSPGPPFFLGMALIGSGRVAEGRALWVSLLARSPADAPWRANLVGQLQDLDAFLARQGAQEPAPAGAAPQ